VSYLRRSVDRTWQPFIEIEPEDALTTVLHGFDVHGRRVFALDSRGRDTAAVSLISIDSGEAEVLFRDPGHDLDTVLTDPMGHTVQAVSCCRERRQWSVLDPEVRADFEVLARPELGDLLVLSRSLDQRRWLVAYRPDAGPTHYYLHEREAGPPRLLFVGDEELAHAQLSRMHPVTIVARDGLELCSYLSLPPDTDPEHSGRPGRRLPMVLVVHGGPWSRVEWGHDPSTQLLTNRGYAVLSVNFRGSTGFGKAFVNAGDGEWGGKMQDDLIDALEWAITAGIADASRVAILGSSYGGYAALMGLTTTPDRFACAISLFGPSNLVTFLSTTPRQWSAARYLFRSRIGDHESPEGRAMLLERSPLTHVERVTKPALIVHGARDIRVLRSESEQIVDTLDARGLAYVFALFPDQGHGLTRPENAQAVFALIELVLAETLGGRAEPIGDALDRAQLELRVRGFPSLAERGEPNRPSGG